MGCGKWNRLVAVIIAIIMASCGGTGGGPSDSGNQFVFTARGRLSLVCITDPPPPALTKQASCTVTLRDPQGLPFRNTQVTFTADFADATFIPGDDNEGAVTTDDNGQATITLIAGLTTGRMRVLAEAPAALNLATGITVELTEQGFVSLGDLGIIPVEVTFINPLVGPDSTDNPWTVFRAVGGTPPYRWDNTNQDLAEIEPTGIDDVNETAKYTLTGPIPTDTTEALTDTVRLLDADGTQAEATVTVIFADCRLRADGTEVTLIGFPGAQFQVDVSDGVAPFTVTETFPESIESEVLCDPNCHIVFTLPDPPPDPRVGVNPDIILIRDARGCTAQVTLTVELCGNELVDANNEQCDGPNFGTLTCEDFEGPGATGFLLCTDECQIDSANCIAPVPPPTVTIQIGLSANPASGPSSGFDSTITALVTDESGTPIQGVIVLFSADRGEFLDPVIQETNGDGQAVVDLRIEPVPSGTSITVTGTAREEEDSVTINVN